MAQSNQPQLSPEAAAALQFDLQTRHTMEFQDGDKTLVILAPDDSEAMANPEFEEAGWEITVSHRGEPRAQRFPSRLISPSMLVSLVFSALDQVMPSSNIVSSEIRPWVEKVHAAYQKRIGA